MFRHLIHIFDSQYFLISNIVLFWDISFTHLILYVEFPPIAFACLLEHCFFAFPYSDMEFANETCSISLIDFLKTVCRKEQPEYYLRIGREKYFCTDR